MSIPTNSPVDDELPDSNTVIVNGQRLACIREPGVLMFSMELTHENRRLDITFPSDVPTGPVQILIAPDSRSIT